MLQKLSRYVNIAGQIIIHKSMKLIDGKNIAAILLEKIHKQATNLPIQPNLVVILVGDNAASKVYINNKRKKAKEAGILSSTIV